MTDMYVVLVACALLVGTAAAQNVRDGGSTSFEAELAVVVLTVFVILDRLGFFAWVKRKTTRDNGDEDLRHTVTKLLERVSAIEERHRLEDRDARTNR